MVCGVRIRIDSRTSSYPKDRLGYGKRPSYRSVSRTWNSLTRGDKSAYSVRRNREDARVVKGNFMSGSKKKLVLIARVLLSIFMTAKGKLVFIGFRWLLLAPRR